MEVDRRDAVAVREDELALDAVVVGEADVLSPLFAASTSPVAVTAPDLSA